MSLERRLRMVLRHLAAREVSDGLGLMLDGEILEGLS